MASLPVPLDFFKGLPPPATPDAPALPPLPLLLLLLLLVVLGGGTPALMDPELARCSCRHKQAGRRDGSDEAVREMLVWCVGHQIGHAA
jgi:hypothetical protein